jgi:hypothetical protein
MTAVSPSFNQLSVIATKSALFSSVYSQMFSALLLADCTLSTSSFEKFLEPSALLGVEGLIDVECLCWLTLKFLEPSTLLGVEGLIDVECLCWLTFLPALWCRRVVVLLNNFRSYKVCKQFGKGD